MTDQLFPGQPNYKWLLSDDDVKSVFSGIDASIDNICKEDSALRREICFILTFATQRWAMDPNFKFIDQIKV